MIHLLLAMILVFLATTFMVTAFKREKLDGLTIFFVVWDLLIAGIQIAEWSGRYKG